MYQEGSLRNIYNISSLTLISQSGMKESTSIFFQIKVGPGTSYWNPFGFLISIQGVRNVLHEVLMDAKYFFFNCEDRDKCYTSNCKYFARQIHLCSQNNLWTSSLESGVSLINQKGSIMKMSHHLLSCDTYKCWISNFMYFYINPMVG